MLFVLSQFMFIVGLFVVPAQLLASVKNAHVDGALVYVVVNRENGDIYMATTINIAYMIHRLDGDDLRIMSSTEIIYDIVIFMIIDYRMRSLIVCTFHSCLPYELDTLTLIEKVTVPALGVVYFGEIVCTPTETNILAFFAGVDNDVLFIGTTPQILSGDAVEFEVPRIASRKSTQDENFLQFLSSTESGDKQSALFLSSFSRSYPEFSPKDDLFVYGFGHNGFSYFVGSFELADLDEFRTEARIARVCQSDKSYSSYMEVPLQCNQTLQGDTVLYRQAVTWAQLTTATPSLEMYVGQDVLYFIMSRDVLCVTSMADIEMAFLRNLDVCLNGADMKSAAPDLQTVTCPQNSEVNAQEVECNVPDNVPKFSGTVPIIGRSIMDVVDTRMGYVVNYGSHSVFVRIAWEKIHTDVITPAAGIFQEFHYDEPHEGCRVQNTLIRLHPDNSHVFIFENISSDIGFGGYPIAVTKVLLANCTLYNDDCSSCVSVAVCGWCSGERRCTMEAECMSGEWLQAEAASFYEYPKRQIHRSCLYIDLVGSYNLTFSPRSGLRIGTTKMLIYVTTEKALSVTEDLLSLYISDHLICPIMYLIHGLVYEYDTILDEWRYRFQCNVNSSEIPEEQGIVSLRYTDSNIRPAVLWLNSTEEIDFVVPTFKSFSPLKGPQAGGTLLEISGTHLLSGNYHDVVIAGRTCELIMSVKLLLNILLKMITIKDQSTIVSLGEFLSKIVINI